MSAASSAASSSAARQPSQGQTRYQKRRLSGGDLGNEQGERNFSGSRVGSGSTARLPLGVERWADQRQVPQRWYEGG